MSYDMEFEEAAGRISDRIYVISDPQLVVTVEKWLKKLTSENRGPNELNYLKLLQYMIENKWLSKPFVRPPPVGPLLPLSRYINPSPCSGRSGSRRQDPVTDYWKTSKSTRATQELLMDSEPSNGDGSDSDSNSDIFGYGDANVDGSMTTVTSANDDSVNADNDNNVNANDGNKVNAGDGNNINADEGNSEDGVNHTAHTERDGHLAGGGGGKGCGLWGLKGGDGGAKAVKLCDVCLDGLGRHLRKSTPAPLDGAYEELLGDCVIPVLTEAEKQSVNPKLLKVLENVNDATSLQDYYAQVAMYTCDQATLMMKSSEGMVDDFRKFVADVLESRAEHISDGLAKEQTALCNKYAYLRDRMMNRATVALDFLREALPVFDWYKYRDDPEAYMKRSILRPMPAPVMTSSSETAPGSGASASGADSKDGGGGATGNDTEPKMTDDIGSGSAGVDHNENDEDDDDDDDDENGGVQQSASKKMMYTLNWLRAELARTECDGQRLHEQRKSLAACLAETDCRLSEIKCQSTVTVDQLKDELTVLRQRSSEQTFSIDRLMESISLIMENKQQPSDVTDC